MCIATRSPISECSIDWLLDQLIGLRERVLDQARRWLERELGDPVLASESSWNLACYLALRSEDLRELQPLLAAHGLSSLGRSESHVVATLDAIIHLLGLASGRDVNAEAGSATRFLAGERTLESNTRRLFGIEPPHGVRIMVTLPTQAADDADLIEDLLCAGMTCARINCAHDSAREWSRMIANLKAARERCGRECRVFMDLAGHKVRTGDIRRRHKALEIDWEGNRAPVVEISDGFLRSEAVGKGRRRNWHLALDSAVIDRLHDHQELYFVDALGRERRMRLAASGTTRFFRAALDGPAHIDQTTVFHDPATGEQFVARGFDTRPAKVRVFEGDPLRLSADPTPGEPARIDPTGNILEPARVPCAEPRVFERLTDGDMVWIDDGKIGARVSQVDTDGALLTIEHAAPQGRSIKPDKGLNFPDTPLNLPALSDKDLADLDFVVRHADMVGFSFVESGDDMRVLMAELDARGAAGMPIVAKIETRRAVSNLPEIMLAALDRRPLGIMIARGDLAVELDPEAMIEAQETLLWLTEAARTPVIWATQVLETLAKKGSISRPELTDAAMAERAECIMLNKGPYIERAVRILVEIVQRMHRHQHKKTAQLAPLQCLIRPDDPAERAAP
ncbi:pyruvate kinase [Guyparkeria hydrothermalis]|uniref:pyruvate kinase n=1 Tax=Guyparkeria hydrothermalis TaxID=923 RepID=UPI00201FD2C8|nr:pyruvate kinase [Guyparkeria hydrothermalis]MCL7751627.1 pyruvate kinase [Guyparkeria hydrothermalis]